MYSEAGCVVTSNEDTDTMTINVAIDPHFEVDIRTVRDFEAIGVALQEMARSLNTALDVTIGPTLVTAEDYVCRLRPDVARAAQLLDQRLPGWHERINIDRLDIANPYHCILGQLYAPSFMMRLYHINVDGYTRGMRDLFFDIHSRRISTLVFTTNVFRSAWIEEIATRRQGVAA